MTPVQFIVIYYGLFTLVRIRGMVRRWRQPLVRGPEYFLNVRVQPDFYSGEGRKILHRYWMRLFIPWAFEIPCILAIVRSGRYEYFAWLMIALGILIYLNHLFSVDLGERQARKLAVPEAELPVASVLLSLHPRRLSDYTTPRVEQLIAFATAGVFAWCIWYYVHAPAGASFAFVFGMPLLFTYAQAGFIFVKSGIVAWRTPIPQLHAEEHLAAREAARKFYLKVCDRVRIVYAGQMLFWPALVTATPENRMQRFAWFSVGLIAIAIVLTVCHEQGRHAVLKKNIRAVPVKMPNFAGSEFSGWFFCYQPAVPMLLIRGTRGYCLNFANRLTQLGVAYVAGFFALLATLRMIH